MSGSVRSFRLLFLRLNLARGFKRTYVWLRGCDKDLRLLIAISLIVIGALGASLFAVRQVERHLLKVEATGAAVHWAEFLQSRLRGLDEILGAGLVSEKDQRIFDFAAAAGRVQDYQVITPDGVVALSNWAGDFRGATDPDVLSTVLQSNRIVYKIVEVNLTGGRFVTGQAYVPLRSGAGKRGVLKVDVDMTRQAERYRWLGNAAFAALIALILPPGGLSGWLVAHNIRARRRSENLQRERSQVLEDLAKGNSIDHILCRVARFAERHHAGSICTIFMLDSSGERVSVVASSSHDDATRKLAFQRIEALPEPFAACLSASTSMLRTLSDGRSVWSTPMYATSGHVFGTFILQFPKGAPHHIAEGDGVDEPLSQLAALSVESRRAEDTLAEMRQRNELILNAAGDGIIGVDSARRIIFANPAIAHMIGRCTGDLIGEDVDTVFRSPTETASHTIPIAATLADSEPRHVEKMEICGPDDRALPVQLVVTPVTNRLSSLRVVVVFQDISPQIAVQRSLRRAKEEAEAASRSKSSFLANMSHELRTPLNAIIGFSEVMTQESLGSLSSHHRDYVQHIHESGQHLLVLINDLLDLSKIEADKLELHETMVDLHDLIERCQVFVAGLAQKSQLTLTLREAPDLPLLYCDERKLKQVLVNLLSNAVKFTPPGGHIVLETEPHGAAGAVVRISDTGIGIATHDLDKVMEPFGQANESLSRGHQGTGLGLPLAKALVELHGGHLEIDSHRGKGTTVTVGLPNRASELSLAPDSKTTRQAVR